MSKEELESGTKYQSSSILETYKYQLMKDEEILRKEQEFHDWNRNQFIGDLCLVSLILVTILTLEMVDMFC